MYNACIIIYYVLFRALCFIIFVINYLYLHSAPAACVRDHTHRCNPCTFLRIIAIIIIVIILYRCCYVIIPCTIIMCSREPLKHQNKMTIIRHKSAAECYRFATGRRALHCSQRGERGALCTRYTYTACYYVYLLFVIVHYIRYT